MPGGVSSPVRSFAAVGGEPPFISRGQGPRIYDGSGRGYIDLMLSFGPLILGHAHPAVVDAVQRQAERGMTYGAPTELESELAQIIVESIPSIDMVRFVNSGTEAVMSALRVARATTAREVVVKFAGGYHGHADQLLAEAGSGMATLGLPSSPGVPASFAALTAVIPYNSVSAAEELFRARGSEIAAVVAEPVAGNMGVVAAETGFLQALRRLCSEHGAVLIFDEVITGFRLGLGGAQRLYDVTPEMTILGKVIGGGLPLAAYGGRGELMRLVAPEGPVYQAGTLSGNPLAVTAGLATLGVLREDPPYERLEAAGKRLAGALQAGAARAGQTIQVNAVGSMLTPFFTDGAVTDFTTARRSDTRLYARFFHALLERGTYPPPSQFEAWFLSTAHSEVELAELERSIESAFAAIPREGANV